MLFRSDYWSDQLGHELPPGWFGENLRIEGIDVNAARIGEQWQIGEQVIVEVTMPRTPCQTFARWVGGEHERGWVRRFSDERRLGPYLRVVRTGGGWAFHCSADGVSWTFVRVFHLAWDGPVSVGFLAQAPLGERCDAEFTKTAYSTAVPADLRDGS